MHEKTWILGVKRYKVCPCAPDLPQVQGPWCQHHPPLQVPGPDSPCLAYMGEYLGFKTGYRAQALSDLSRATDQIASEEVKGQKRVWELGGLVSLWAAARHIF